MAPKLKNRIDSYDKKLSGREREEYEKELGRWVEEGILQPWDGDDHMMMKDCWHLWLLCRRPNRRYDRYWTSES